MRRCSGLIGGGAGDAAHWLVPPAPPGRLLLFATSCAALFRQNIERRWFKTEVLNPSGPVSCQITSPAAARLARGRGIYFQSSKLGGGNGKVRAIFIGCVSFRLREVSRPTGLDIRCRAPLRSSPISGTNRRPATG